MMTCIVAKALRQEARKVWNLPPETVLTRPSEDWVTVLLDKLDEESKSKVMFIWWRAWHHQNNIIFDKGKASIPHSVRFLNSYFESMQANPEFMVSSNRKGKQPIYRVTASRDEATSPLIDQA